MNKQKNDIAGQIKEFKRRLKSQMPHVRKEILVYEKNTALGIQKKQPKPSPQFKY
ncbi:hypothetical protein GCM10011339_45350 [Echinicola rosea]|uniref:Uncharacterized protein n=1 Tax=Echinicola rosea TaxID=1807691 RepID=A0ABQ1VBG3_9BACT|nr:hypothetical protein GCM10011339_45350 [Echinicola rosea]